MRGPIIDIHTCFVFFNKKMVDIVTQFPTNLGDVYKKDGNKTDEVGSGRT